MLIFSAASRVPATMRTTSDRATAKGSIKKFGVCVGAWLGKAAQEGPRCPPKLSQNEAENLPKWTPNGGQEVARRAKKCGKNAIETKRAGACHRSPILAEKVANMAPTWAPRWSPNRTKIDTKINQKIDASWDRFLEGFW